MFFIVIGSFRFDSHFIPMRLPFEQQELLKEFREGLQGASLAAGVSPPKLIVVNIKGVSSVSLKRANKKPFVALTLDALNAGLSRPEAEGLMAHELSHILIGNEIYPPGKSRFDNIIILLSFINILLAVTGLMFALMAEVTIKWLYIGILPLIDIGAIVVVRSFNGRHNHEDLLADSVAVKITKNPAALKNAITKLANKFLLGIVAMSFFGKADRDWKFGQLPINSEEAKTLLPARLRNLEAIEQGHWPVFE